MQQDVAWQVGQEKQPQLKVLVVDDEDNIIELIRLGLRYEGFQVEVASDGEQGITVAQRENPDLIILDVMMPGIDGLEVCRRLRDNPTTRDVPILMLTAKDEVGDRILGLKTGADDYVTKPFDFYELLERIRAILRRQNRARSSQGGVTPEEPGPVLQFADLRMNTATHEVTRGGRLIELTLQYPHFQSALAHGTQPCRAWLSGHNLPSL